MSVIKARVNDPLALNVQLYDGDQSLPKRVFVTLRDHNGVLLEPEFEIGHVGGGLFRENVRIMPDETTVSAQFKVTESDGTTLALAYSRGIDIYVKDIVGQIVTNNLDAKISSVSVSGTSIAGALTGELNQSIILGTVKTTSSILVGNIVSNTITGVIIDE